MKKLLYVTAFPPNHKSGGQTFSMNAIRDLSSKYIVDLVYFRFPGHDLEQDLPINSVVAFDANKLNCMRRPLLFPIFTKRFSDIVAKQLQEYAEKYDVLYFDYSQVAIYSLVIRHPFKVIRCHDIMAQRYYRKNKVIYPWVKKTEYKILKSANKVFVPSLKDKRILSDEYGIESEYTNEYISTYEIPENTQCDGFIMFGRWARGENLEGLNWFLDKVCPLLDSNILEKFTVMGGDMDEKTQKRVNFWGIKYIGFIDDAYSEIVKRKAMVVPLFRGAGVKVKVLDSFSVGTAVIGTDVAFEGIPLIDGLVINACDEKDFAREIKKLDSNIVTMDNKRAAQNVFVKGYNNRHVSDLL